VYSITVAYSEDEARLSIAEGSRDVVGYFKLLVSYLTLHASHVSLYFVMETLLHLHVLTCPFICKRLTCVITESGLAMF